MRPHIRELDGLRAVAVILVLIHHCAPRSIPGLWRIANVGWVGVDCFFVLSGFLITRILLDTRTNETYYRDFYARRTLRIFPLYYGVLALIFGCMILWNHGAAYVRLVTQWGSPLWTWLYLGNVQMALLGATPTTFALAPTWSLHVEEQFYLLFPFAVRKLNPVTLLQGLLIVLAGAPLLRLVSWWWKPSNVFIDYMLLPCRADALAMGAVIAIAVRTPLRVNRRLLGAVTVAALLVAYGSYVTVGHSLSSGAFTRVVGYSLFPAAFAAVVLWIVLYRNSWQTNWLNARPVQFIGRVSYGVYLLQAPVAAALGGLLARTQIWAHEGVRFLLIAAVTTAAAALSWRFLEQPLLQLKDRLAPVRRPQEVGIPA